MSRMDLKVVRAWGRWQKVGTFTQPPTILLLSPNNPNRERRFMNTSWVKSNNQLGDGNNDIMLYGIKEWLKVGTGETKVKYCKAGQERDVLKEAENETHLVWYNSEKCTGVNTVTARPSKGKLSMWSGAESNISVYLNWKGISLLLAYIISLSNTLYMCVLIQLLLKCASASRGLCVSVVIDSSCHWIF